MKKIIKAYLKKVALLAKRYILSARTFVKDLFHILGLPFSLFFKVISDSFIRDISSVSNLYVNYTEINTADLKMEENCYSTNFNDHKLWLDIIYDRVGVSNFVSSLVICLFPLCLGLIYSLFIKFEANYIATLPIWLGVFGIFLTCFTIRFGSKSFHDKYSYLRPCFMISDISYKQFIKAWFDRLANNYPNIVFSIFAFLIFITIAYIRYFHYELLVNSGLKSIEPKGFLVNNWYGDPHLSLKYILMAIFAAFVAFPLITSLRLLYVNFFFLLDFRNLPVIPFPNILKIRLRKITNMYIVISVFWMIGVSLFGILFFTKYDAISLGIILSLSFLGFATFIAPQLIYRSLLIRSEEVNSSLVMNSFYENIGGKLDDKNNRLYKNIVAEYKLNDYVDIIDSSHIADKWIYNPIQVITFIIGQGLAISSPYLLDIIEETYKQITMYSIG